MKKEILNVNIRFLFHCIYAKIKRMDTMHHMHTAVGIIRQNFQRMT